METNARDLAIMAAIALLLVLTLLHAHVAARQRALESQLSKAHTEIAALRERLTEATRPPTQFARMRMRDVAGKRFARLRLAVPRRSHGLDAERVGDRRH